MESKQWIFSKSSKMKIIGVDLRMYILLTPVSIDFNFYVLTVYCSADR